MASLIGPFRICKDAVLRYTPNENKAVISLILAYDFGPKGDDGHRPSQFIDAALWGPRAEALAQYLLKSTEVYCVIDDPRSVHFQRRDGTWSSKIEGRINQIDLGKRPAIAPLPEHEHAA